MRLAAVLLLAAVAGAQPAPPASMDALVRKTMAGYTVRSRLGPVQTPLPLELANFLLDHPDVSAQIVRNHKIAPYRIVMKSPNESLADDGEGTQGDVILVRRTEVARLYYGEGTHDSAVFPRIHATAVIVMTLKPLERPGCPDSVETSFEVYVRLKNAVLAGFVKALRPFLSKTIVRKFGKAFLVADQVGRLMAERPGELASEVHDLPGMPDADRARLLSLMSRLAPDSCPPAALK